MALKQFRPTPRSCCGSPALVISRGECTPRAVKLHGSGPAPSMTGGGARCPPPQEGGAQLPGRLDLSQARLPHRRCRSRGCTKQCERCTRRLRRQRDNICAAPLASTDNRSQMLNRAEKRAWIAQTCRPFSFSPSSLQAAPQPMRHKTKPCTFPTARHCAAAWSK